MSDLTPRQTQILRLVQRSIAENGMPPDARGDRAGAGISLRQRRGGASAGLARKGRDFSRPGHLARHPAQGHHARAAGPAAHRARRRRCAHPRRGAYRGALPDRSGAVSAAGALPSEGRRHEHEERRASSTAISSRCTAPRRCAAARSSWRASRTRSRSSAIARMVRWCG
jgi:hypothetical protein